MMWFFAVLIVLALGGVAMVAAGWGTPMTEEYDDRPDAVVPADRPLAADDLRRVRFSLAFRGYRASEVDTLLDRLASEMSAAPVDGSDGDSVGDSVEGSVEGSDDTSGDTVEREPGHAAPAVDGTGEPD